MGPVASECFQLLRFRCFATLPVMFVRCWGVLAIHSPRVLIIESIGIMYINTH